tara:strand:- start:849 stop:1313 length:465 start_codon:yes stop_codon:yes gene_type:complete
METHKVYNSNIFPTYVFYDSCFSDLIQKINIHISEEVIGEFRDDKEILDYLYRSELSSVFEEENIEKINFDNYETLISLFNNSEMKECIQAIKDKNIIPIVETKESIQSCLIPIFFSYHLFFFTHMCIQDIILQNGNISEIRKNLIKDAIESLL